MVVNRHFCYLSGPLHECEFANKAARSRALPFIITHTRAQHFSASRLMNETKEEDGAHYVDRNSNDQEDDDEEDDDYKDDGRNEA